MRTIIIFTRGTSDDEFENWYSKSNGRFTEVKKNKFGNVFIAGYNKDQRQLYIVNGFVDYRDLVKEYFDGKRFENALVLYHNISDKFEDFIKEIKAIKHKRYSSDDSIHLPPKPMEASSHPLDKLLDSIQNKKNAYEYVRAFDEVWKSFLKQELNAALEFLHQCLFEKPPDLRLLTNAGIKIDVKCSSANDKKIEELFSTFEIDKKDSFKALHKGLLEQAGVK